MKKYIHKSFAGFTSKAKHKEINAENEISILCRKTDPSKTHTCT